jgi:hypothetical protein
MYVGKITTYNQSPSCPNGATLQCQHPNYRKIDKMSKNLLKMSNSSNAYYYFTNYLVFLWPFGIFCGGLVYFPRFGMMYEEKSDNTGVVTNVRKRAVIELGPSNLRRPTVPWKTLYVHNRRVRHCQGKLGPLVGAQQGDQIGRIFAHWVTVFFGHFFKLQKKPKYLVCLFPRKKLCIKLDKK